MPLLDITNNLLKSLQRQMLGICATYTLPRTKCWVPGYPSSVYKWCQIYRGIYVTIKQFFQCSCLPILIQFKKIVACKERTLNRYSYVIILMFIIMTIDLQSLKCDFDINQIYKRLTYLDTHCSIVICNGFKKDISLRIQHPGCHCLPCWWEWTSKWIIQMAK